MMDFPALKASIGNNAGEQPSIYMALCMVESLFGDVEAAAGQNLCECPMGSEQLATKLVWLCQEIRRIYRAKDTEIQRNRSRLDAIMTELAQVQAETEDAAQAAGQIAALQEELRQKQEALRQAKDAAAQSRRLKEQCAEAERELASLEKTDDTETLAHLQAMQEQIAQLRRQSDELEAQRTAAQEEKQALEAQWNRLVESLAASRAEVDAAEDAVAQKEKSLA